jgi:peptidylprolyl isomerase
MTSNSLFSQENENKFADYIETESGLKFIITQRARGVQAKAGDKVAVHYKGTLLDGTKFDSSYDKDQPFVFEIGAGQVIKGWDEGIALLHQGDKATFVIPSELAYGERDMGTIPPNSTLIFEVELIKVEQGVSIEAFNVAGKDTQITQSGLKYIVVEQGNGDFIKKNETAKIHYTGYLSDGTIFDSSVKKGKELEFPVSTGSIIKGLDEGVLFMKKGGKCRLIIPASLGFGDQAMGSIPANSTLIFDVELIDIIPEKKVEAFDIEGKKIHKTNSGLEYIIVKEGAGKQAEAGLNVEVHYTGYLENGEIFDSSVKRGKPIDFPLGTGRVIKGWDEGIAMMKVGGKRRLIIPSELGYGSRAQGSIPANATLIFDVELVNVK